MLMAHYQHPDKEWHLDTRATHHLTNDMNNIHVQADDYDGHDHIQVADGASLKMVQSGTSTISSPSKSFVLNQILLVLGIQNLLSNVFV